MYSATLSSSIITTNGLHELRVWVSAYTGFTGPNLLVMQQAPDIIPDPDNFNATCVFMTVASPSSLVEYKIGTPEAGSMFYLSDHANFKFDNKNGLDNALVILQQRINLLCKNMNKFDGETGITTGTTIGDWHVSIFYTVFLHQYDQQLNITITGASNNKVLLKNRVPGLGDTFIGVCSPEDIVKYPAALATGATTGYFRDDNVSIIFNNGNTMMECRDLIMEYLQELADLL